MKKNSMTGLNPNLLQQISNKRIKQKAKYSRTHPHQLT